MDVTARSHSRRWPMLAVTGLGVAFAWFVLTLFAAPADAHADDGDGPLDTLAEPWHPSPHPCCSRYPSR